MPPIPDKENTVRIKMRPAAGALLGAASALLCNGFFVWSWRETGSTLLDFTDKAAGNMSFFLISSVLAILLGYKFGKRVGEAQTFWEATGYGALGASLIGLMNGTFVVPIIGSAVGAVLGAGIGVIAGAALYPLMPTNADDLAAPGILSKIPPYAGLGLLLMLAAGIYLKIADNITSELAHQDRSSIVYTFVWVPMNNRIPDPELRLRKYTEAAAVKGRPGLLRAVESRIGWNAAQAMRADKALLKKVKDSIAREAKITDPTICADECRITLQMPIAPLIKLGLNFGPP